MTLAHRPVAAGVLLLLLLLVLAVMGCDRPPKPPIGGGGDSLPPPGVDTLPPDTAVGTAPEPDDPSTLTLIQDPGHFLEGDSVPPRPTPYGTATMTMTPALALGGLAVGASAWDRDRWCDGPFSGTFAAGAPNYTREILERAKECNIRVVLVWPRRLQTVNGQNDGAFSVAASNRLADTYAKQLSALKPFVTSGHFIGFLPLDDMGCDRCWGGKGISPEQAEQAYKYAKQKLPGIPLGIRVAPSWIKQRPGMAQWIDFAWAQYVSTRGDYKKYYDNAIRDAKALNLKLAGGINIYHFSKPFDGDNITASQLQTIGSYGIDTDGFCFYVSWLAWDGWQAQGRGDVWADLIAKGRNQTAVPSCAKGG